MSQIRVKPTDLVYTCGKDYEAILLKKTSNDPNSDPDWSRVKTDLVRSTYDQPRSNPQS